LPQHDLDLFDFWRVETQYGPAFIELSVRPRPDVPVDTYRTIWPLPRVSPKGGFEGIIAWTSPLGRTYIVHPDKVDEPDDPNNSWPKPPDDA